MLNGKGLLAMVSGGPDSIFLLQHLHLNWKKEWGELRVIHCNHHLRGAEADYDQALVEKRCRELGLICHVVHGAFAGKAALPERARSWRYREALRICRENKIGVIATAHHRDDQLETLVFRASRGAGLSGMSGIRRWHGVGQGVKLFRPLLGLEKNKIIVWLSNAGIMYREDLSNKILCSSRNIIRHILKNQVVDTAMLKGLVDAVQALDSYFVRRFHDALNGCADFVPLDVWYAQTSEVQFRYIKKIFEKKKCRQEFLRRHMAVFEKNRQITLGKTTVFLDAAGVAINNEPGSNDDEKEIQEITGYGAYYMALRKMLLVISPEAVVLHAVMTGKYWKGRVKIVTDDFPLKLKTTGEIPRLKWQGKTRTMGFTEICRNRGIRSSQEKSLFVIKNQRDKIICVPGLGVCSNE